MGLNLVCETGGYVSNFYYTFKKQVLFMHTNPAVAEKPNNQKLG